MKAKLFLTTPLFLSGPAIILAASVTWLSNPADNNWSNPANWSTGHVPGNEDEVHFGASTIHDLNITSGASSSAITFEEDAPGYLITALPG